MRTDSKALSKAEHIKKKTKCIFRDRHHKMNKNNYNLAQLCFFEILHICQALTIRIVWADSQRKGVSQKLRALDLSTVWPMTLLLAFCLLRCQNSLYLVTPSSLAQGGGEDIHPLAPVGKHTTIWVSISQFLFWRILTSIIGSVCVITIFNRIFLKMTRSSLCFLLSNLSENIV